MNLIRFVVLISFWSNICFSSDAYADLIINGSFELGDFNNLDSDTRPEVMLLQAGNTNILGWNIVGGVHGVHWIDWAGGPNSTTNGTRNIDLVGTSPTSANFAQLTQSFATTTGVEYRLIFDAFTGNEVNTGSVSVGTLKNQSFTGGGPGLPRSNFFQTLSFEFIAESTLSTLSFTATASDGFGPVIDNVRVVAVPEPSSVALVGLFALATLGARHRFRSSPVSPTSAH